MSLFQKFVNFFRGPADEEELREDRDRAFSETQQHTRESIKKWSDETDRLNETIKELRKSAGE